VTQKILLAFHDRFGDILNSAPGGGGVTKNWASNE